MSRPKGRDESGKPARTRVFLTGASGNWGRATLRELRERADRISVTALVLPTERDRTALEEFSGMENLNVVWGDLTDPAAVERCVADTDIILHVGAVVSPLADQHPELARKVNIGSMRNIIRAVKNLPDPSRIKVVGVGSVAETGNRAVPHHWGRIGDPIRVSTFDEYGQTKVIAERELADSGLPRWAWLRQTGIFHPDMLTIRDPIMTHSTLDGVMEWVSVEDSARLLANICEPTVPDEFWGGIYNIGGGAPWRLTNWELQTAIADALGVKDITRWYDRNWFATGNFHGHWYTDSDRLQALVPFRQDTFPEALSRAVGSLPAAVKSAGKVPGWLIKHLVMKPLTRQPRGTMHALRSGNTPEINAHFGSLANWQSIGDWSTFHPPAPDKTPVLLDHGYDETKKPSDWTGTDYSSAAEFRGGHLLTQDIAPGQFTKPITWRCAFDHAFDASPRLVLTAGHWCPTCVADTASYPDQAARNPFLAQLVQAAEQPVHTTAATGSAAGTSRPKT
ncbi:NAD(P)-dependent oxidoreductase [Arthrobacter sp. NicSoilC5]|uniref:NAD-dependent epimerase/dehydratase family protein n=1 Tax=Arthrobacter sp. NicSoilC5 TaxID=2831000 RepID=UPI001CC5BD5A|nr:NAD(P)-dependent oxidoreductase [Arthrobacter sp. NicSoilC5]BCW78333.1 epimerase [Arthrobacter sp. NicSoilC5]